MQELGLVLPIWLTVLVWVARIVVLVLICSLLAWLGIRALDALTPEIHERQRIGENPISTGLFIGGFFIMVGLVIQRKPHIHRAIHWRVLHHGWSGHPWGGYGIYRRRWLNSKLYL